MKANALRREKFYLRYQSDIDQMINRKDIPQALSREKWLEKELENAQRELQDTIKQQQGMTFKVIMKDGKFIHTLCDGQLLYQMGLTPEQVIGKELKDFLPEEMERRKNTYYIRAWNGEENVTYEGKLNGVNYLACLRPIRKNGIVCAVIGSCINITEQKRAEEALRLKNFNYQVITDNMLDLITKVDINGVILYASPSYEKVFGISPALYEGKSVFDLLHPEDVAYNQSKFYSMIQSKTPCQYEFRCINPNANESAIYIESQATFAFGENNKIEYIIVVGRNITERKKIEELTRKSEKLAIVGQLASSIAHEIRNPLTTVKGFIQLLQEQVNNPPYMDITLNEVSKIEDIINEFLEFATPKNIGMKELDIKVLVKQVIELLYPSISKQNVVLTQEYGLDLPNIYCNENHIKEVFIHILQNAMEAMPSGGTIKVQIHRQGLDNIKISFIDQGYGISKERMKTIGEPFYCLNEKGTGLGLMISNKIVHEHGGDIQIKSEVNKGTTVDMILPIRQSISFKNII